MRGRAYGSDEVENWSDAGRKRGHKERVKKKVKSEREEKRKKRGRGASELMEKAATRFQKYRPLQMGQSLHALLRLTVSSVNTGLVPGCPSKSVFD